MYASSQYSHTVFKLLSEILSTKGRQCSRMSVCLKTQTLARGCLRGTYDVFGAVFLPRIRHITTSALRLEVNMNRGRVDHVFELTSIHSGRYCFLVYI